MSSQPQSISASVDGLTAVACLNEIFGLKNGRLLFTQAVDYVPSSIAINPSQTEIAVGGTKVIHCGIT